jgi:hypothetical protein
MTFFISAIINAERDMPPEPAERVSFASISA